MFHRISIRRFSLALSTLAIAAMLILGCASLNEDPSEVADRRATDHDHLADDNPFPLDGPPHGTPIEHDEMPDAMRARHDIPDDATVERMGGDPGNAYYRVEYADGTVYLIGPY